jgi:hypothetical protein
MMTIQQAVTAVIMIMFVLALSTTAKGEIDLQNVSKMTKQECYWLPNTSFSFPNATESELNNFFNESAAYCKELLRPQPPY